MAAIKKRVPADERLLNDREVAARLGVSRSTVKRMRRDRQLPTVYVRGAARVPLTAVNGWLAADTDA